jgi:hypothetical protein
MKNILITPLCIIFLVSFAFSQSKKELKAVVSQQGSSIDSLKTLTQFQELELGKIRAKMRTDSIENAQQQELVRKVIEEQNLEIEKEREARKQEIAAKKDEAEKIAANELKSEEKNKEITQYLAKAKNTQDKLVEQLSVWGKASELYSVEQAFIRAYNAKCGENSVSKISHVAVPNVFFIENPTIG